MLGNVIGIEENVVLLNLKIDLDKINDCTWFTILVDEVVLNSQGNYEILEQYDVSEVVLDADLEDFIALCVRYRLVEV